MEGFPMKRAVLYLRVSTIDQTTANQERELREVAGRMGCEIAQVYKDHGISGAKGRDKRPAFDRLCKDAAQRKFDVVMAWSGDRRGGPAWRDRMAAWLRWILGSIMPPISPRLPA
jgi:DNA invertase Pin-like site-specific DNA recombinase